MHRFISCLLIVLIIGLADTVAARAPAGLDDPVAHGAWLYKANCTRCHGLYEKERPGESYTTQDRLESAVAEKGCRIAWSRSLGGTLTAAEISAVCRYILAWEQLGREPDLPVLPELPETKIETPVLLQQAVEVLSMGVVEEQPLSPQLQKLVATNSVAKGGWLYTRNCHRCHLSYDRTRQGRGMSGENLRKIVENGKTSTQMTGFGVLAGGKLKNSEIEAVLAYITAWEDFQGPPAIAPALLTPPATDPAGLHPIGLPRFPLVQGDEKKGRELFLTHCSRCHNPDRSGYIGRRLLPPWDSLRPDLFLKTSVKSGIPGSLMVAFSGDSGPRLSPKEIDDLIAFLLTEAP